MKKKDNYLYFTSRQLPKKHTDKEVGFLIRELNINLSSSLIDLACGYGRHTNSLAPYCKKIVGVDINANYLEHAKSNAFENVKYILHDITTIDFPEKTFDAGYIMCNTFPMLNTDEQENLIEKLSIYLKNEAKICLETLSSQILNERFSKNLIFDMGADLVIDRLSYQESSSCLINKRIYIQNNQREDVQVKFHLLSKDALFKLLKRFHFKPLHVYENALGDKFTENSINMTIIAEKTAP